MQVVGVQQDTPQTQIVADGTLCGCFDDFETCCLTFWTCGIHPYATNRERAGVMACLPSVALVAPILLISVLVNSYAAVAYQIPYEECVVTAPSHMNSTALAHLAECQKANMFAWPSDPDCNPCFEKYSAFMRFSRLTEAVGVVLMFYSMILYGRNRSQLQVALGQPDAGCVNYILYAPCFAACCATCALCQEARAVKGRWVANGRQPLTSNVRVSLQPGVSTVAYAQAPM